MLTLLPRQIKAIQAKVISSSIGNIQAVVKEKGPQALGGLRSVPLYACGGPALDIGANEVVAAMNDRRNKKREG